MIESISTTLHTADIAGMRAFYERHFDARATFDCGWYLALELGPAQSLCLMEARPDHPVCTGGITLNLKVPNADGAYDRLVAKGGLTPLMPLEDHPWGDRGFCVADPCGVRLYCYHDIPPSPEYAACLRTQTEP